MVVYEKNAETFNCEILDVMGYVLDDAYSIAKILTKPTSTCTIIGKDDLYIFK